VDTSKYLNRVNSNLDLLLSDNNALSEVMRYSSLTSGKRFRPILTYAVADSFGVELNFADSSACAVELIHIYSLIHDDLPAMDDDDMRHNQPSCHKKFGQAQAILAGDALQARAFEIIANDEKLESDTKVKLIQILSNAAFEMAEGQSIDLSIVAKTVDIETLKLMHSKKTGALLKSSVELGAVVSGCSKKDLAILQDFAKDLGLAYQIQDDVLDIETPEELLGKKQNSDAEKNKPTYPKIIGLQESKGQFKDLYDKALNRLDMLSVDAKILKQLTQKLADREF